jgi:hypothetical protein
MQLEEVTLAFFAACNSARVLAYLPQIHKAAVDRNGASAISFTTWSLFLIAHVSTIAYALVNRSDPWLALCFTGNALCCLVILAIAWWKSRGGAASRQQSMPYIETLEQRPHRTRRRLQVHDEHRDFSRAALLQ